MYTPAIFDIALSMSKILYAIPLLLLASFPIPGFCPTFLLHALL